VARAPATLSGRKPRRLRFPADAFSDLKKVVSAYSDLMREVFGDAIGKTANAVVIERTRIPWRYAARYWTAGADFRFSGTSACAAR